jgi:CRP-like cAMP-binding protein
MTAPVPRLPRELALLLPPQLHGVCEAVAYPKGARVFRVGDRPSGMFYVTGGEVTLQRYGADGEQLVLQRVRRGFAGEASLQSDRYHCDAIAVADSRVVRVPIGAVQAALQSDPAFAMRWIGMLNQEVRRLRQRCERLGLRTVEARLMHLVEAEGDGSGVAIDCGLKSVARELGVTHEALYRCVSDLQRRGMLERTGARLRRVTVR